MSIQQGYDGTAVEWDGSSSDPALVTMLAASVREHMAAIAEIIDRSTQAERDAQVAQASRLAWSGPSRMERQIARAFGIPVALLLLPTRPSALDARYHRRYRNRQGRR